jgi:predicted acetylornithine/succinylornithine family transaminase
MTMTQTEPDMIESLQALNDAHVINTYGARSLAFDRGEGCRLWDAAGNEYLDCFAGIAVTNLGHNYPAVTKAISDQAAKLLHCSNLYYIESQARVAELLSKNSFAQKWFFANCGGTANEAAIKIARRYWFKKGTPKPGILVAEQSFHGRTLATITATGQPKYQEGFEPLVEGFTHVPYNDVAALERAITPTTGAIMLEPIQGEGGVRVPDGDYLAKVRTLCDKHNLLLMLDEVQTGIGRTGKLFAHEHCGIEPDIITIAKALGNGVPIGAMGCTDDVASGFDVGSHATTFGGNPLCTAAAYATLTAVTAPGFLDRVAEAGAHFKNGLNQLAAKHSSIVEVRGEGLMIGVEFSDSVAKTLQGMTDRKVICGPAGPNVIRFVPPLIISNDEIDRAVSTLDEVLSIN